MNLSKLLQRTTSGIIYCLLIALCAIWGEHGILLLAILLSILAVIEFSKISNLNKRQSIATLILDIVGVVSLCFGFLLYPLIIWLAIILFRFIEELYINSYNPIKNLAHSMMSQIYIGVPMGLMTAIGWLYNPMIILGIFVLIWINDTGAFIVGCSIGKHKLFERISPKKTWEGFIGGMIFCIAGAVIFNYYCSSFFGMDIFRPNVWIWIGLAVIVSIFGTWGDLVESMIKRNLNIKDSGHMIPGHGGILDRIDSLLLALPAVFIYFLLIGYSIIS